jgi:ribosome-binding protein aMBF1 (putative translation factor)
MLDSTGELVQEGRLTRGLTQAELAEKAGVAKSVVQRLESGEVKPHNETIRHLPQRWVCLTTSSWAGNSMRWRAEMLNLNSSTLWTKRD